MNKPFSIPNPLLEAAESYAARRWRVVPLHRPLIGPNRTRCSCSAGDACRSCGKHPATEHGWKDGTCDPDAVRAWWKATPTANVGIVTGAVSGIVVLDIDLKHGGDETLRRLEETHGALPPTVEAITGTGGGHRFFRHPGNGIVIPISASKIGDGLDIRADGGLVVGVPSLHACGQRYTWESHASPDEAELADMPEWLLKLVVKPKERPAPKPLADWTGSEKGRHWLGKALAAATDGNRNDTGHWLACQLRDAQLPRGEAEPFMRQYAQRVPQGSEPYTETEALRSLASAYSTPPRPPAESRTRHASPPQPRSSPAKAVDVHEVVFAPASGSAGDELATYLSDVMDGRVFNVPFPWEVLTDVTQALLPGSFCVIGGDPGVGKTFFVLQCLQYWHANGFAPAVFFLEKNRRFHTMRLLAQLERNGKFIDHGWVKQNPAAVVEALARHKAYIDEIGTCIWEKPTGDLDMDMMIGWLRDRVKEGRRVIVIDPITAIDAGADRWTKDDKFVRTANDIITAAGASIVSITHPKQIVGKQGGTATGHAAAGGAAYFRFTDTMIWLTRAKTARRVMTRSMHGSLLGKTDRFFQLFKTRDGKGAGSELAYEFCSNLKFSELGVVVKDVKDKAEDMPQEED